MNMRKMVKRDQGVTKMNGDEKNQRGEQDCENKGEEDDKMKADK